MKQLIYSVILMSFFLNVTYAQEIIEKEFSNVYDVSNTDKLKIDNSFGNVFIENRENKTFEIRVVIKAWARTEEKAQKVLNNINIDKEQNSEGVFYKTNISTSTNINDNKGFEITYFVTMPSKNPIDIKNKFGSVHVENRKGNVDFDISYGSLDAEHLEGAFTFIDISYSHGNIESIRKGTLKSSYCNSINIEDVGELKMDDKYGHVNIENVGMIEGTSSYSGLNIEELEKKLEIKAKYGSVKISEVHPSFESIEIDSGYGAVNLGFEDDINFDFTVDVRYGSFNFDSDEYEIRQEIIRNTSTHCKGSKGSKGKGGKVYVEVNYGSVKFR